MRRSFVLMVLALAAASSACTKTGGAAPLSASPERPASATPEVSASEGGNTVPAAPAVVDETDEAPAVEPPIAPEVASGCALVVEGMACVPAGEFTRGIDDDPHACVQSGQPSDRASSSEPSARIYLDEFYIDLTEVTNAAYALCVEDRACASSGPRYSDFGRPTQPIVGVSWYDATTYCEWAGKRLPTEAEWEKAARGADGERTPFGDSDVTCVEAVIQDGTGRSCGVRKGRGDNPETGRVLEVGSRPAGRYGLFDMVGNAEEWVADWWTSNWESCGDDCRGANPRGPCAGSDPCPGHRTKVVRGGSWYWPTEHATGYHRRRHVPSNDPFHHFGFRCAASVAQAEALPR